MGTRTMTIFVQLVDKKRMKRVGEDVDTGEACSSPIKKKRKHTHHIEPPQPKKKKELEQKSDKV